MRIVLLSPGYPPQSGGGLGAYTATVAKALARAGHETFVVTWVRGPEERAYDGDVLVVRLDGRPRRRMTPSRLRATLRAGKAIRGLQPDVIQAPEYFADAWALARTGWRARLVTRLATPTYLLEQLNEGGLRPSTRVLRLLERDQARRSAAIVAPTRAISDLVASEWRLDRRKIHIIPNAVEIEGVRLAGRAASPVELPARFLVFPARAEVRKGAEVLAAALPGALAGATDVHAIFLGACPPSMVERLVALAGPVAGRVRFLGQLPRDAALAVVARAELVVLPSLWENFSNSALEAMALARPLIATDVGGFAEFVEHGVTGWLVPPGEPQALAAAVAAGLADPEHARALGARAAAAVTRLAPDAIAARLIELYHDVATEAGPG
jgi:glycosyltransferase involved in cell wall biosynthesis